MITHDLYFMEFVCRIVDAYINLNWKIYLLRQITTNDGNDAQLRV